MLLTVLTPTLNCACFLPQALSSVVALERHFPGQVQHLIADAGSSDGTWEILAGHEARHSWARAFQMQDRNIPASLNALMPKAEGSWFLVLNGDDVLEADAMAECLRSIGAGSGPAILCGDILLISRKGDLVGVQIVQPSGIRWQMSVAHIAMLTNRQAFQKVGHFNEACPTSYDYEWIWRSRDKNVPIRETRNILAQFRLGGISQTRRANSTREIVHAKWNSHHRPEAIAYWAMEYVWPALAKLGLAPRWRFKRWLRRKVGMATVIQGPDALRSYRDLVQLRASTTGRDFTGLDSIGTEVASGETA